MKRIYWVFVNGKCMERTDSKRLAWLSAYVYACNKKNNVRMDVCRDYCVPTVDNRVWEECAFRITPEQAWEIAEAERRV